MATREELLAEAYRRGLMPPQQRAAYEEGQRRGIVKGAPKSEAESFTETFWKQAGRTLPGMLPGPAGAVGKIAAAMFPREATGIVQRGVNTLTGGAADEVVSAVPAVAAAVRGQSPRQAFTDAQRAQQRQREQFAQTNPRLATGADIGGGVMGMAIPGMGALKVLQAPKTLGGAIATGAGLGAAGGGFTGFMSADEGERLPGLIGGATTGAAIGGAIPALTPAVQAAIQRFGGRNPMQIAAPGMSPAGAPEPPLGVTEGGLPPMPQVNVSARAGGFTMPKLRTPEDVANQYLARVLQSSNVSPRDLRAAAPDITAAEAIGRTGQRQLGALARREGQTGEALESLMTERRLARPTVLQTEFASATGVDPEAAAGNIESMVDAGRRAAAPLYERAYQDPIQVTPMLADLSKRPTVQKAMNNARRMMLDDGLDPSAVGLEVSPASGDIPEMIKVTRPTLQTWDYVKRGLDDELERLRDPVTGNLPRTNQVRQITELTQTLRGELTDQSNNYRDALANSADYLSAQSAFQSAGKKISDRRLTARTFAAQIDKMNEGERAAMRAGIANWANDLVQTGKMTPKVFSQPIIRDKLRAALGEDGAASLIATAEREAQKAAFENRYGFVNSTTDELRAAGDELATGLGGPAPTIGQQILSPVTTARNLAAQGIDAGVAALTQPGQVAARDVLGQRYMMSPQELADFLEANQITIPPPAFPGVRSPNPFRPAPPIAPAPRPRR
jgi:hypothetical protein